MPRRIIIKFHFARKLRKEQTPHEIKLWNVLRNREINNLKFRRQYKIGKYIVDFCCLDKKLVVELDGGHHNEKLYKIKDQERQQYIESQGYTVLRFWNNEVDENLEGIIEIILEIIKK